MALNFPSVPTNGQTYTYGGITYYYDSSNISWLTTYVAPPSTNLLSNTSGVSFAGDLYFPTGNVGIGRTSTTYKLDIVGTVNASAVFVNGSPITGGSTIGNEDSSASTFYPVFTTTTAGTMTSANVDTVDLTYVPSSGTLSAKVFNSLSDITLKTDIEGFDGVMLLDDINPVSFRWKNNSMKSYGVIAQELEKAFPDLVQTNEQGIKSVSYMPLIGILLDVVKKQQKDIEEIKKLLNRKK